MNIERLVTMANDIAAQVTVEKYRAKLPCTPKDPKAYDDVCARKILSHYGLLLFRRPLTEAELDNRAGLSQRSALHSAALKPYALVLWYARPHLRSHSCAA